MAIRKALAQTRAAVPNFQSLHAVQGAAAEKRLCNLSFRTPSGPYSAVGIARETFAFITMRSRFAPVSPYFKALKDAAEAGSLSSFWKSGAARCSRGSTPSLVEIVGCPNAPFYAGKARGRHGAWHHGFQIVHTRWPSVCAVDRDMATGKCGSAARWFHWRTASHARWPKRQIKLLVALVCVLLGVETPCRAKLPSPLSARVFAARTLARSLATVPMGHSERAPPFSVEGRLAGCCAISLLMH